MKIDQFIEKLLQRRVDRYRREPYAVKPVSSTFYELHKEEGARYALWSVVRGCRMIGGLTWDEGQMLISELHRARAQRTPIEDKEFQVERPVPKWRRPRTQTPVECDGAQGSRNDARAAVEPSATLSRVK